MKNGKQVRTTTRADRRDGAERDDDYMDVDGEEWVLPVSILKL